MTQNLLLSIKPTNYYKIKSGLKTWEFRKRVIRKPYEIVYIYVSYPIKQIRATCRFSDTRKGFGWMFTQYYKNASEDLNKYLKDFLYVPCVAYRISEFEELNIPLLLEDFQREYPPQSFYYLT